MAASLTRRAMKRLWRDVAAATTDAYLSLTSRPGRTLAMIAGILLGVASAMTAVLIADTQQAQVDLRFDAQRSPYVMLQAQEPGPKGFSPQGSEDTVALEPVMGGGELSIWREDIEIAPNGLLEPNRVPLVAATAEGLAASGAEVVAGAPFLGVGSDTDTALVWVGSSLADRLRLKMDAPRTVHIQGRAYGVAGIFDSSDGFEYLRASVIIDTAVARKDFGPGDSVRFLARVRPGSASAVGQYALAALDPKGTQRLVDVTQPDGERLQGNVARDMRRLGVGLGLFVGFVGMVAVANTLSMAVSQRTRELGLRSAIGWSRSRIGTLVLLESAVAGAVAATMGAGLAMLGAFLWSTTQGWALVVNPVLAPIAVAGGTVFSVVGGLVPAYRAATVSPLTAMRS